MENIKIIIADDHALFVNGLQLLLAEEGWVDVTDVANDGKELLEILTKTNPDIILLDINMPVINGLDAAKFIKQSYPSIKIIILSTYNDAHLIDKAKDLGVNGYLLKNCSKDELFQTIKSVMNNRTSFPYMKPIVQDLFNGMDVFLKQFNLTKREAEIIQLIKNNFTNQEMANKLFLSIYTVETHRKNIMVKLNLKSPTALIKFILENNL
ncbi:MAG: response regulator transcription factor [Ferruginibacter sp.]